MVDVTILGAGAVGCTYAALLQRGGADVQLFGRGEHLRTIRRSGLTLETRGKRETFQVNATARLDKLVPSNITLVCVPLHQLAGLREQLRGFRSGGTLPLCNGLTATDTVRGFGLETVFYGTTVVECSVRDNGWVILETEKPRITLGFEIYGYAADTAKTLRRFGLNVSATKQPMQALWQKAAFLIPVSLACAKWKCTVGEVRANQTRWHLVLNLMAEIVAEARASGHNASQATAEFAVGRVRKGMIPSAARDVIAGRPSELPHLVQPLRKLTGLKPFLNDAYLQMPE